MIDRILLKDFDSIEVAKIREALKILASTGVLIRQRAAIYTRITEGSETEDAADLALRIKEYRVQSHQLTSLHQLGESFLKEDEDHEEG